MLYCLMKLFHETNSNTVLLRSSERVRSVTLEGGGDTGSSDTALYELVGDDLGTLLGEEQVPLGGTGSLIGVAGELDLGVRVGSHEGSDLVKLGNLGGLDIPLVDDEVDILLEFRSRGGSGLSDNDRFRFRFRFRSRSGSRGRCRRRNHHRGGGLLGRAKGDLQAKESGVLVVHVRKLAGTLVLLGIEVVAEAVNTSLEVELDGIGETDVKAETSAAGGAELLAVPQILEGSALGGESLGLTVVESQIGSDTEIEVRAEETIEILVEDRANVEGSVEGGLSKVELVNLSGSGSVQAVLGALGLPTHEIATETEDRAELIADSEVSGRAEEVLDRGLADSMADAAASLDVPVRVELLGESADTHQQCGSKNKYSFFHKYKFISNQYLKSATRNVC